MRSNKFISIFFCVTSGLNEDDLGSDEAEIINISNIILDLNKHETIDVCEFYIKPLTTNLSDECKNLTHLNETYFVDSISLDEFFKQFEKRLLDLNLLQNENEFVLLTDGPLHLRQAIIPECYKKEINIPDYFFKYFDLKKEFKTFTKCENLFNLNDICDVMQIKKCTEFSYSLNQCKMMVETVLQMIQNQHLFSQPELISKEFEQSLCSIDDNIEENTIIRIRGLPWQCTDSDVNKFFAGLNIANGGVALCLSPQGRRNGEALVRFKDEENRNLALKRHKHHIGQRYIEVYRATGKEFLSVAGGSNSEAKAFLSRNGKVIIRMRGLPFDSVAKDVVEFFERGENSCEIIDDEAGVLFVHYPDGRSTGDAFVMFKTEEEANKALLKHKEMMGVRYIELFRSTAAEVQQVFKRSQDPKFYQANSKDASIPPLPILPPEMISGGNRRDCIRLKNLPLDCGVEHILEFLGVHSQHIIQQGVHMILNSQAQPSGEAFIQFDGEQSALNASIHKNSKFMYFLGKKFFIEVTQCSGEEMNLVLMGLLPSNLINYLPQKAYQKPQVSSNINQQQQQQQFNFQLHQNLPVYPNMTQINPILRSQNPQLQLSTTPMISQPSQFINSNSFTPLIWYYPTPPVSPSSAVFIQQPVIHPCVLIVKNAPVNITVNDILNYFIGYEIIPDCIQIQNNSENNLESVDVYITLYNRNEAERAVIEKNHQKLGNNLVELFLSI